MNKILVIDDEIEMLHSLQKIFSYRNDFEVSYSEDSLQGIRKIKNEVYNLVITDLKMQGATGIDVLKAAKKTNKNLKVIIISGYGTIEASVEAMRYGASDFIEKPFTSAKFFDRINKVLSDKASAKIDEIVADETVKDIIYTSKEMHEVINLVKKIAPGDMNVLITGESGTGKELIARAIHKFSKGNTDPFVPVNVGALPENLFESELFGHEKGAFTGAIRRKPGLLEFANHGTFFFDEIGELTPALQVKLLRMLEERKIRRVGGQTEIDIDVRIIAASNKNLLEAINKNLFREDLFYRLTAFQIDIPPLRERTDDIMLLANHFLNEICSERNEGEKHFTKDAEDLLKSYPWPGNVRELQNVVTRSYFLCPGGTIDVNNLPIFNSEQKFNLNSKFLDLNYSEAKEYILEKFEVEYLTHHLKLNNGNISKTATQCNLDRRTLHRLIKKYNIIYKPRADN